MNIHDKEEKKKEKRASAVTRESSKEVVERNGVEDAVALDAEMYIYYVHRHRL